MDLIYQDMKFGIIKTNLSSLIFINNYQKRTLIKSFIIQEIVKGLIRVKLAK